VYRNGYAQTTRISISTIEKIIGEKKHYHTLLRVPLFLFIICWALTFDPATKKRVEKEDKKVKMNIVISHIFFAV